MSAAKCAEELDFSLSFQDQDQDQDRDRDREQGQREGEGGGGGGAAGPGLSVRTPPFSSQLLSGQPVNPELSLPSYYCTTDSYQYVGCHSQGPQYAAQGNLRAFDCPSIQITSIAANNHVVPHIDQEALAIGGAEGGYTEASWSRDQLYLPLDPCYRDPAFCPSPCSSMSSRSWMSDLSSCESFSHIYDDVEGDFGDTAGATLRSPLGSPLGSPGCGGGAFGVELWQQKYQHPLAFSPALSPHQSPRQSPCHSPRTSVTEESWLNRRPTSRPSSRPTSPCGKRRHSSADPHTRVRSPSPHHSPSPTPSASPRDSVTEETWFGSPALGPLLMSSYHELDVPSKTRRTSGTQLGLLPSQGDPGLELFQDSPGEDGCEQDGLAELFLQVPSHFSWNKPKPGNAPLFRTPSPPPLDWPLPSQHEQCELRVDVQPKSYHRAHYETEGSRGSIKAAAGGHPVIQLSGYSEQRVGLLVFIGTSDDRYVRPHPFYQVHRVTGKTVTTTCQEKIMGCTKVLEIPLLPENNMSASIDCAGILKLRNADIELKKGETDIGRKNTRVRVVFRVSVPQPDGQMLWLQTSSVPVECSQRSGQEVPQVESFSSASCSVDGGEELLITGSNISTQSRVVFLEKGPDGRSLWEADARVVPEKSSSSSVVVEVPPYHKKTTGPVQVQFYISNGKRRKSPMQSFTYLPGARRLHAAAAAGPPLVKQENWQLDHISHSPPGFSTDVTYYDSCDLPVHCGPPPPPPSSAPLPTPLMFPHTSSLLYHASSSSALPPQTLTPPPQTTTTPPHMSSVPTFTTCPQTSSLLPHTPPVGRQREQPPSLSSSGAFVTPADPQSEYVLGVKQEPEDQPNLGSLGLQEITLDDVNEIIDRDICSLSAAAQPDLFDQYHQYDCEHKPGGAAAPFSGSPR